MSTQNNPCPPPAEPLNLPVLESDGTFHMVKIPRMSRYALDFLIQQLNVYADAIMRRPQIQSPPARTPTGALSSS